MRVERETGFEPATLSLGNTLTQSASAPDGSQILRTGENGRQESQSEGPPAFQALSTDVGRPNPGVARVLRPESPPAAPRGALRVVPGVRAVLLTVQAVAARLGVSKATVYKLADRGALPHVRVGTALRFVPAALAAFEASSGRV